MEHQEDACDRQNDEEEARDTPQAEGIGESEAMPFDLSREDMKEEVVVDQQGPLQVCIRYSGPEDGKPKRRVCDALNDSFLHLNSIYHKSAKQGRKGGPACGIGSGSILPGEVRWAMVLLHGDGTGWTTLYTKAALDAARFFFEDDGGKVEFLSFFHRDFVERLDQSG